MREAHVERTASLDNFLNRMPRGELSSSDYVRLCAAIRASAAVRSELGERLGTADPRQRALMAAGRKAEEAVVAANLRLVVAFAARYRRTGLPMDDLIQAGNIGLIYAAGRYDERLGFRFSTYAYYWITSSIGDTICSDRSLIRLPRELDAGVARYRRGEAVENLEEMRRLDRLRSILDLAQLPEGQQDATSGGAVAEAALSSLLPEDLARAIAILDARSQEIITLRYGLGGRAPMRVKDLAQRYGLTRERIRQIHNSALAQLRSDPAIEGLAHWLR